MKKIFVPVLLSGALLFACDGKKDANEGLSGMDVDDFQVVYQDENTYAENLVATAYRYNELSTFYAAVKAADLDRVLAAGGPYTIMAPTNDAFARLPAGTLEDLMKPENKEKLVKILMAHVSKNGARLNKLSAAPAEYVNPTDTLEKSDSLKVSDVAVTAEKNLEKNVRKEQVIPKGTLKENEILASNGVIRIVDRVILP